MKRITNNFTLLLLSVLCVASLSVACDRIYVEEDAVAAPVIGSFAPESGVPGTIVVVTGQNLNAVTRATIGGRAVTIVERVSNTRLSLRADASAHNGKLELFNSAGSGVSAGSFSYETQHPSIQGIAAAATGAQTSAATLDDHLLLDIDNIVSVKNIYFCAADETAEGGERTFAAEVVAVDEKAQRMEVVVPYVNAADASVVLEYFDYDRDEDVMTPRASGALTLTIPKPSFDEVAGSAGAGLLAAVKGSYLNHVDHLWISDGSKEYEAEIELPRRSESLRFIVPQELGAGLSGDEQSGPLTIRVSYFGGDYEATLSEDFKVLVANVKFWSSKRLWAQGRVYYSTFESFFSPETGEVYHNSRWKTEVDPVAYAHQGTGNLVCSAGQTPNKEIISEAEYLSVNPYFFFTGSNNGFVQLQSPANSNSQLRNFYTDNNNSNEFRVTETSLECYGTPVLTFRLLNPTNAAQKAVIDKVKDGTLYAIDEETFPIAGTGSSATVGGVAVGTSASLSSNPALGTAPGNNHWAGEIYTPGMNLENADIDRVVMVLYYGYNGYAAANAHLGIRRIGFIHIRTVNFRVTAGNTTEQVPPSGSDILFNCYWQSRDYDYSKLAQ